MSTIHKEYNLSLTKVYNSKYKLVTHLFYILTIFISGINFAIFDRNTFYFVISVVYMVISVISWFSYLLFILRM